MSTTYSENNSFKKSKCISTPPFFILYHSMFLLSIKWREDFCKQKELRRALCLQADNGSCLACELNSWRSHKGEWESAPYPTEKKKSKSDSSDLLFFWRSKWDENWTKMSDILLKQSDIFPRKVILWTSSQWYSIC